jgi:two-component system, NtrC family, sensor kinase
MFISFFKTISHRLYGSLVETLFESNINHLKKIIIFTIPFLLGIVLLLGWISAKKVREVVIADFNQQQLVLAKHAARQIESDLDVLKRELSLLSLSPSIQYSDKVSIGKRMGISFSSIREEGVLEIRYIEAAQPRTHLTDHNGYQTVYSYPGSEEYLGWAGQIKNKGGILIGEVTSVIHGGRFSVLAMEMAIPVWQVSTDESRPVPSNSFSGVLLFIIDVTALIEKVKKDITSGKTGYAWVIDSKGIFLYHPEAEFIGKNAFEARHKRETAISFAKINEIQKDKMMKGEEGASWYDSGWHRGVVGKMRKLIAYAPIQLSGINDGRIWSVAVVAPVSEVEGAIDSIQIRQFVLEGFVIVTIFLGGLFLTAILSRWSNSLKAEVESMTRELRKSEHQYKSLIENANDIIFTVNRKGEIASINEAGCAFFRKQMKELSGVNIGEFCFNEESAFAQLKAIDEVYDSGVSRQITYSVNVAGEEHWLNTNFNLLLDENRKPYAIMGISRDITAERKKEKEEQMYHAEKLASMGTLAAGVAHEINNPLAIILGFVDLLIEKVKPESQEYDILKTVEKQSINAKRVVEKLLSFSRYTEYHEEPVDINDNLETVLAIIKNTLLLNNISLKQDLQAGLPKVKADAGELQQVFMNIINNASHAMSGGGTLTVTTASLDTKHVLVSFADTGHGIKKNHRAKIFDPLFTTKRVGEGTGLGLSVSYGIITKYGGTITFETKTSDESKNTGTTFTISLPALHMANNEQQSREL